MDENVDIAGMQATLQQQQPPPPQQGEEVEEEGEEVEEEGGGRGRGRGQQYRSSFNPLDSTAVVSTHWTMKTCDKDMAHMHVTLLV